MKQTDELKRLIEQRIDAEKALLRAQLKVQEVANAMVRYFIPKRIRKPKPAKP